MRLFLKIIFLILITGSIALAQANYEPVNKSVYGFLERMSLKGVIRLNEEILPFTRMYIAEKLIGIAENQDEISDLEKEELAFYVRDFSVELKNLNFNVEKYVARHKFIDFKSKYFGFDRYNRFRLLKYNDGKFAVYIDPVFRVNYTLENDDNSLLWSNGLRLFGDIGANLSFDLQFYDNHFNGKFNTFDRTFSPQTGYEWNSPRGNGVDFDRMNVNLTYSWIWGNFIIGKDYTKYGTGENGKIVLSDKAPSFPQIKLEIYPVKWLKFSYIHGLLNSQVLDSTTFRFNPQRNHISTVDKFFVSHFLSITSVEFFNISLGESVIYSDKFQPIYLIPIAFFRFSDHYLSDPDENAGNAQLFASFWYKNYSFRTKFYGSLFIDELSISNPGYPQAYAYNVGFKTIDPLIPESELVVEYTRVLPFVYFHADSAQTYENYGYQLGHWIGSNADQIYIKFKKRLFRGLDVNFWYGFVRKGSEEDFNEPRYQSHQTFLWGERRDYTFTGVRIVYELINDLYLRFEYNNLRTEGTYEGKAVNDKKDVFVFSVGYGIL